MPRADGNLAASSSQARRLRESNATARVATAIVGVPIVLVIVWAGGWWYAAAVVIASVVAAAEAYVMLRARGHRPAILLGLAMSALLAISPRLPHSTEWFRGTVELGAMGLGVWFLIAAQTYRDERSTTAGVASGMSQLFLDWAITLAVALYTGGLLASLTAIRQLSNGVGLVIFLLVLTWAFDSGAYVAGRAFGHHSFMNQISSGKTWEGVMGGLTTTIALALLVSIPVGVSIPVALVTAGAVTVSGQAGDLLESLMKRYSRVKDSGRIIPGHGGLLDRIDSLFFTGAAAYYVFLAVGLK